jgi:hypothetical protein
MLRKGPYKLSFLFGSEKYYKKLENNSMLELYNIDEDPEELENLFDRSEQLSKDLLEEMKAKLVEKNLFNATLEMYLAKG